MAQSTRTPENERGKRGSSPIDDLKRVGVGGDEVVVRGAKSIPARWQGSQSQRDMRRKKQRTGDRVRVGDVGQGLRHDDTEAGVQVPVDVAERL